MPSDAAADAPRNGRANRGSVTIVAGASPAGEPPARVAGARVDIADGRSVLFHETRSQQEYAGHARSAPRRLARASPRHAGPLPRPRTRIRRDAGRRSRRRARGCAEPLAFGPVTGRSSCERLVVTDTLKCRSELRNTRVTGAKIFIFFRVNRARAASYASHTSSVCKKRVTVRTPTRRTRTPA